MADIMRSLTMMVYGGSKVGKSTFAVTSPYPRLMLDVEGGHRFLPIAVKYWDPIREEPPVADGTWDTCVVVVREYDDVIKAYEWLRSGRHQFKSLIIDSISELQVKLFDKLAGSEQIKMQQWGEVLRHMGGFLRDVRDLTSHPTAPLDAIVLTAMAKQDNKTGQFHPYLQGQLATQAPYFYDLLGAVVTETVPNPDPTQPAYRVRKMLVESTPDYEAGERVQGRLGTAVEQQNLSVERMLDLVYGPVTPPPAAAAEPAAEESTVLPQAPDGLA